jgi:hypothetical protein
MTLVIGLPDERPCPQRATHEPASEGRLAPWPTDATAGVVAFTGEVLDPEDNTQLVELLNPPQGGRVVVLTADAVLGDEGLR